MMHPDTILQPVNPAVGLGVVATKRIPRGTIIWVRDSLDRTISPADLAGFPESMRLDILRWCFIASRGDIVLCWDHGRFVNHACEPNCTGTGFDVEVAIRDIEPGEELTDDYGRLQVAAEFECHCGSPRCRRVIHADDPDLARYGEVWVAESRVAIPSISKVPQPLGWLIPAEEREALGV